jgi:hypothetical protein
VCRLYANPMTFYKELGVWGRGPGTSHLQTQGSRLVERQWLILLLTGSVVAAPSTIGEVISRG